MQEIPILGISFLDEDAQSYTGEERVTETGERLGWGGVGGPVQSLSERPHFPLLSGTLPSVTKKTGSWNPENFTTSIFSPSMPTGV